MLQSLLVNSLMMESSSLGFMQGRLSPQVDGKIQSFPWDQWQKEFPIANSLGLTLMEWTLDQDRLYQNPLLTPEGQRKIRELCELHRISIPSLTGDCFMQAPFWKLSGKQRVALQADFISIVRACAAVEIKMAVIPLVDNGRLEDAQQEDILIEFMLKQVALLRDLGIRVTFESDFPPGELARFINRLPADSFGVNYDIGNSASSGYCPEEEFLAYGSRINNVHIKDRALGSSTVPLGTGNADFPKVFRLLRESEYIGNLIIQAARARDGDHSGLLRQYIIQVEAWLNGSWRALSV